MRFGLPPDDSDAESSSSHNSSIIYTHSSASSSDISFNADSPRGAISQRIRALINASDSEDGPTSEVEYVGSRGTTGGNIQDWRETLSSPRARRQRLPKAESSSAPWRRARMALEPLIPRHEASPFEGWLKTTEEEAMRDGHRLAHERRGDLQEITTNARQMIRSKEQARQAREEEEMATLLRAMAIKQNEEEADVARRFAEREKQLWSDIDAAIKEVDRKEAEMRQNAEVAAKRSKEEEAHRAARAEAEARVKRAVEERKKAEAADTERKKKEDGERQRQEAQRLAEERAKVQEATSKEAKERNKMHNEWSHWVGKQRWMKENVINPVKADRTVLSGLKKTMRLMGRGLGQVVNTQETIVRVAAELHSSLLEQLPGPPSIDNPITLETAPKPYLYLLSHISKSLIKQAESEVSASSAAAFPLGRIVVLLLLSGHAAFGDILFARLVKKCPWVVPYYPIRQPNQPRDEYEKSTGRGSDESIADYVARMNGIFTLYLAIIQTPITSLVRPLAIQPTKEELVAVINAPLRFTTSWTWLAHAVRDPLPGLDPTATLILTWIEVLGAEAIRIFGQGQMGKVLVAIRDEGIEGGKIRGDSESARQQLGMLVKDLSKIKIPVARQCE